MTRARSNHLSSPLLTLFRLGNIPLEVRDLAARGGLTCDTTDQLGLLLFLLDDPDPAVSTLASQTFDAIPRAGSGRFSRVPKRHRSCGRCSRIAVSNRVRCRRQTMPPPLVPLTDTEPEPESETEPSPQMLASLPVIDKIKLGLRGTRDQRIVLVRDPNKVVAVAVMGSPKLNPTEVEIFARMTSVQEEVLRIIGTSRRWVKYYPIAAALVANAKTPLGIAMGLVKRLNERDLKVVARDRNVSDGIRAAARKFVATGQARRR